MLSVVVLFWIDFESVFDQTFFFVFFFLQVHVQSAIDIVTRAEDIYTAW